MSINKIILIVLVLDKDSNTGVFLLTCVLQAERELHTQRLGWLRLESVHRVLREIIQENRFSKASSTLTAEDKVLT